MSMRVGELIKAISTTALHVRSRAYGERPSILSVPHAALHKFLALFPAINILCYSPQFSTEMTFAFAFRTVPEL
jgi:hypothetical protein